MIKKKLNEHFQSYKLLYLFTLTLLICGFIFGVILFKRQNIDSINELSSFLDSIMNVDYINNPEYIQTNLISNSLLLIIIFVFGLSLLGIPAVSFILFTKGLQIGFSCALYLESYAMKGILGILLTLIPQILFEIIAVFTLSLIALEISLSIIYACFLHRRTLKLKDFCNHYLNYFIIALILILISTLFKIYLLPSLYKLFIS